MDEWCCRRLPWAVVNDASNQANPSISNRLANNRSDIAAFRIEANWKCLFFFFGWSNLRHPRIAWSGDQIEKTNKINEWIKKIHEKWEYKMQANIACYLYYIYTEILISIRMWCAGSVHFIYILISHIRIYL